MNPLLESWDTPFGLPPFGEIEDRHYLPAFRAAMAEEKQEVAAVLATSEAPTFDNTIVALERVGKALRRISPVFFCRNSSHSNDAIREVARTVAPEIAMHRDDILLDRAVFERVQAVWDQRQALALDTEQERLLEETHKVFVRAGVGLESEDQARLREINREIAELNQQYSQNVLAENNAFELWITRREDLGQMPESLIAAAADEARRRGHDDGWSFTLARPSFTPFLQYSPTRDLRRQLFLADARRGNNDDEYDNKAGVARAAALRAERAKLLGYETHAHYVLADAMAEHPDQVYELLDKMWQAGLKQAVAERDALAEMMQEEGVGDKLRPWDWYYYAERVRRAKFDLSGEELRPYFELSAVRKGAFMLAEKLFDLSFVELEDVPKWHPDQKVFEVREADGRHVGILYMDAFARESKRGGAWMNDMRPQSRLDGVVAPVVTNDYNFPPPSDGSPSLLSFSQASTLFHEFGHALHGLLSDVTYPSLSGTNVPRDFVEFPSQVLENWLSEPAFLRLFAKHYRTGEVIPEALIAKIKASETFNQGFSTVEYMAACYLDMSWHTLTEPSVVDTEAFERAELQRIGLIEEIEPRYWSTHFTHIFSGGYASGYYGYLWSEVLDADAFQAFLETDLFDRETARRYRRLLSQGGTRPGMDLYREFRGREPAIDPLLKRRGLSAA